MARSKQSYSFSSSNNQNNRADIERSSQMREKEPSPPPSFGEPPPFKSILDFEFNESHPTKIRIPRFANLNDEKLFPPSIFTLPDPSVTVSMTSKIQVVRDPKGDVISQDPLVNENDEELWKYLSCNLFSPQPLIHLKGTRQADVVRVELDANGKNQEVVEEETVVDFDFYLDVSILMESNWRRMAYVPRQGESPRGVREALKEYVENKNPLKELRLVKQPVWNWSEVAQSMHYIVRSTGYSHKLEIEFPVDGGKVEVKSCSQLSKLRKSSLLQGLACLSCAWVCLFPMYLSNRKRHDCFHTIAVDYAINISPDEFYTKNYWPIFFRVTQGNKGHFKVQT